MKSQMRNNSISIELIYLSIYLSVSENLSLSLKAEKKINEKVRLGTW